MLTLDETTLFFYSYILSSFDNDKPRPSKKHKGDDVSKWLNTIPISLPHKSTTKTASCGSTNSCVPSLTVGSSYSTTTSVLTQGINITKRKHPHPLSKVEALETYIEVVEDGPILDYDETQGEEQEIAMVSPTKGHQHVSSEVCTWYGICYIIYDLSTGHHHPNTFQTTNKIYSNRPP